MAQDQRPVARNYVLLIGAVFLVMFGAVLLGLFQSCGDTSPGDGPAPAEATAPAFPE